MENGDVGKFARQRESPQYRALMAFFDLYPEFQTPSGCPYSTIADQLTGRSYYLPEEFVNRMGDTDNQPTINAVSTFFGLYEAYRRAAYNTGAIAAFAERQAYHIPPFTPGAAAPAPPPEDADYGAPEGWDDVEGDEPRPTIPSPKLTPAKAREAAVLAAAAAAVPVPDPGKNALGSAAEAFAAPKTYYRNPTPQSELDRAHYHDDTCLMLDFDIYQPGNARQITAEHFNALIQVTADILMSVLDFGSKSTTMHAAILCKATVRPERHTTYKECFKDSFHCRIFTRMTKETKRYVIARLREGPLASIFSGLKVHGPIEDILDGNSAHVPPMLLASAKRNAQVATQFHSLYEITFSCGTKTVLFCTYFDTKVEQPSSRSTTRRPATYIHPARNLAYELSIAYADPRGIIKKEALPLRAEMLTVITTHNERRGGDLIAPSEIEQTKQNVLNLTVRDSKAKYLAKILDIIDIGRIKSYQSWRDIICMLASESADYKPLAYSFSQRTPAEYTKGTETLEQIWEWARTHPSTNRTIATLYHWAKQDNRERYTELQKHNTLTLTQNLILETGGDPNEDQLARILHAMFQDIFVCDIPDRSLTGTRAWYEFVMPSDDPESNKMLYKWRLEQKSPDTLDLYIASKMPLLLKSCSDFISARKGDEEQLAADGGDIDATIKYYDRVIKKLALTIRSLGTPGRISGILSRCERLFRRRGFIARLNTDQNSIGAHNCVLILHPRLEVLECFHTIPITRSCNARYIPYISKRKPQPRNAALVKLKAAIKQCFIHSDGTFDRDSYRFVMIYLATSLDGRRKVPRFFIWFGEGGNGKSFILEMHTTTLGYVSDNGYGCKLNCSFFTQAGKYSGPDSEKMSMEYARSIYTSEFPRGATLMMDRIKEFTSEVISGNDKNEKQKMFLVNANFICGVNYIPNIAEQDYGTWRRLLAYRFQREFKSRHDYDPKNPLHALDNREFGEQAVHDIEFRSAYLGLLVHYYEKWYMGKYQGDINNAPQETIRRTTRAYRDDQNVLSRFITNFVKHRDFIQTEPGEIVRCKLVDVVAKYCTWYMTTISAGVKPNRDQVLKDFKATELRKDIVHEHGVEYINNWYVFGVGEEQKLKTVVSGISESGINVDEINSEDPEEDLDNVAEEGEPVEEEELDPDADLYADDDEDGDE